MTKVAALGLVGVFLVAAACSGTSASRGSKLSVTAAFYPLQFLAERIGGDAVSVTNLTPPGAEPHDLELRPSDVAAIRSARIVLYLRGLQPAVDDAIKTLPEKSRAFNALELIPLRHLSDGSVDPHFWLDPTLFSRAAAAVEQRFEQADAKDAGVFQRNLTQLDADLAKLDRDFNSGLAHCASREIFTGHAAFGYVAARYGLRQIAITGLNPEAEPSPKDLGHIIQLARQLRPTVVYAETLVSSRAVDAVARAVGARVAVLNPIEGLLPAQRTAGADYLSLMHEDLQTLELGLSCQT
jgi:zinc transport system substrate-binding protein